MALLIKNGERVIRAMPDLTIIITTYKRFDSLHQCLLSINMYAPECKELIMIDSNDTDTFAILSDSGYLSYKNIKAHLSKVKLECCGLTNLGVELCDTEYFVYLNDDMVLTQKDDMKKALAKFKELYPDNLGFITFNDGIQNGSIITQGLTSKTFVKECLEHGKLCNPAYIHFKWDAEQAYRVRIMNKLHYMSDIVVQHNHYSKTNKIDPVYIESSKLCKADTFTFKQRNPTL